MIFDSLTSDELARYSRHISIPEFNESGQLKLKNSRVLVIGAGGLGSPVLYYLAAAGVGTIGIVDFDVVDESNLQRQILYTTEDIGKPKATAAREKLHLLNPHINVLVHMARLTAANALEILQPYDVVVDGTDNFPTRYLVNDACVMLNKPYVYGSIFRFEGQVAVFNYTNFEGLTGPNYRDLFPTPPPPGLVPSCAEGGVLGVLPGIIGSMQANEAIKVLAGIGEPISDRLLLFDALLFETRFLHVSKRPDNPLTGNNPTIHELMDYDAFCGLKESKKKQQTMKEITVQQLKEMMDNQESHQLIDVREEYEYKIVNLGGELIPMGVVEQSIERFAQDKTVIVMCRSGVRSARIIESLEQKYGYTNLYNLKGGILAWAYEIDSSFPTY
jgi:sulfur-carrier protein adenylyltransferase/sulfurtransferase